MICGDYILSIVQKENGQLYKFIDYKNKIQELWQCASSNARTKLIYATQGAAGGVESRLQACNTLISTHPQKEGGRTHLQLAQETENPAQRARASLQPSCPPPQAICAHLPPTASPLPLPKPLLLSAAARTATNARRRGGKAGRSQGVEPAKHKGQRERDVVSAMAYLVISIGEARRKSVGAKASPTSTQWLASEESVGCHQATSGVVARLKVVAWRPALRPVHHASHAAASGTALQLRHTSLTQELAVTARPSCAIP